MEKEEVIQKIQNFFVSRNISRDIGLDVSPDEIKFREAELSEEGYDQLVQFLRGLGFSPIGTWEENLNYSFNSKSYLCTDDFRDSNDNLLKVYYTKIWTRNETLYVVERIEFFEES